MLGLLYRVIIQNWDTRVDLFSCWLNSATCTRSTNRVFNSVNGSRNTVGSLHSVTQAKPSLSVFQTTFDPLRAYNPIS